MSDSTETVTKKSKKPSIESSKVNEVLDRVQAANPDMLSVEDKSGWKKVTSVASGKKVYIQLRDDVHEVHLSGFGAGLPGTVPPPKKNGRVEAHLDMSGSDPYGALEAVLTNLATQKAAPAATPTPRVKAEPKKAPASDEDRVARIAGRVAELGLDAPPVPVVEAVEVVADASNG